MALVTLEAMDQAEESNLDAIREEIRKLRQSISAFRDQIERGEGIDATAVAAEVRRSTGLFDACLKVENRLEEIRRKDARVGPCGYGFDLDAARASIGCTLHRLRCNRDSEDISG